MLLRLALSFSSRRSTVALCAIGLSLASGCAPKAAIDQGGAYEEAEQKATFDQHSSSSAAEQLGSAVGAREPETNAGAAPSAASADQASTAATAPPASSEPEATVSLPGSTSPALPRAGSANGPLTGTPPTAAPQAGVSPAETPAVEGPLTPDDAGGRPWLAISELPYEYWETQYLNANRIGVTHYKVEKAGSDRLTLTATSTLEVKRGGQPMRQKVVVQTIERADGRVESYFEDIEGAGMTVKVTGSVSDGKMPLRITSAKTTTTTRVPWSPETWGPMGVHQLLLRQPMQSGERRLASVFVPQIHKTARVTLVAGKEEDTPSPDGMLQAVLPIDVVMQMEDQTLTNRIWTDAQGQVKKSVMTVGLNVSSYRVSREAAERAVAQGQVDLFEASSIKLEKPLVDADKAERIVYEVRAKNTDPFSLLSRESNQTARSETAFQSKLTVWRPSLDGPPPQGARQTPPSPECLASTPLIQSDDPLIAKLAVRFAGDASEPADVAQKLTEGVYTAIRKKNFSRSFDAAQDVARTMEGDCTEHAVLLAALLRNRGIPARLASGVIVQTTAESSECVYHMWNEAWIGDRWLPLDATRGRLAGCDHIKFLETPLAGSNPYAALLPVMSSLGQLSISVEEVVR